MTINKITIKSILASSLNKRLDLSIPTRGSNVGKQLFKNVEMEKRGQTNFLYKVCKLLSLRSEPYVYGICRA